MVKVGAENPTKSAHARASRKRNNHPDLQMDVLLELRDTDHAPPLPIDWDDLLLAAFKEISVWNSVSVVIFAVPVEGPTEQLINQRAHASNVEIPLKLKLKHKLCLEPMK